MNSKKIYIILFVILYAFVAIVSGIHGFAFFGLANTPFLAGMLAVAFEVGQAAVLFSILTNPKQGKKIMPWVLMVILTLVQVMGNVYNCYKYLLLNSETNLKFFKEPIFIWTDIPDAQANVIISYLTGAILPIVGLLLTSMVTSFLGKENEEEVEYIEEYEEPEDTIYEDDIKGTEWPENDVHSDKIKDFVEEENQIPEDNEKSILKPIDEPKNILQENPYEDVKSSPEVKLDTKNEVLDDISELQEKEKSHFINI